MPFVFLASQLGRRLPPDLASRRRPCLGLVVILMYLATHESEPPTGDFHPYTHAHAGRTQSRARDRRPLADLLELNGHSWAAARDGRRYAAWSPVLQYTREEVTEVHLGTRIAKEENP